MVNRTAFLDVLGQELPFVRVSLQAQGLCDLCFAYRDSICTVADKHLVEKTSEWRAHLNCAHPTRDDYRSSQLKSRSILHTNVSN